MIAGAAISAPLVAVMRWQFGLEGAAASVLIVGLGLAVAGYALLAREGRQPAWHHHLAKPLLASLAMVPVCLLLRGQTLALPVLGGAVTYLAALWLLGGLAVADLRMVIGRRADRPIGSSLVIPPGAPLPCATSASPPRSSSIATATRRTTSAASAT